MRGRFSTILLAAVLLGGQPLSAERSGLPGASTTEVSELAAIALATAAEGGWEVSDGRILIAIGRWLSVAYGFPAMASVPTLESASPGELLARRYPMFLGRDATVAATGHPDLLAVYDDHERTIYVSTAWEGLEPAAISILVHEMVHHMQNEAGMRFACAEEREKQAFAAQADWLALFGTDLATEFGIDDLTLLVRTRCFY